MGFIYIYIPLNPKKNPYKTHLQSVTRLCPSPMTSGPVETSWLCPIGKKNKMMSRVPRMFTPYFCYRMFTPYIDDIIDVYRVS